MKLHIFLKNWDFFEFQSIFQGDFLIGPQNLNSEGAGHDEIARFSYEGELFCKAS